MGNLHYTSPRTGRHEVRVPEWVAYTVIYLMVAAYVALVGLIITLITEAGFLISTLAGAAVLALVAITKPKINTR